MRFWLLSSVLLASLLLAGTSTARAEFHCQAKIGYTVELTRKPSITASTTPGAEKTPPVAQSPAGESTVFLEIIEAKGVDEATARDALSKSGGRQLEKVRGICRDRHENVGGCIASKFQTNATTLHSLGFQARKALEEALQNDCELQRGICKKTEISEPACKEIIAPPTEAPAEADAKGAKDDKKKGKK